VEKRAQITLMSYHVGQVWSDCLSIIKDNVNEQSYKTWFIPIKPIKIENNILTIQVPSQFFYEWLEEHYVHLLSKTIKRVISPSARLEYRIVMDKKGGMAGSKSSSNYGGSNYQSSKATGFKANANMPQRNVKRSSSFYQRDRFIEDSMSDSVPTQEIKNPFIIPGLKKTEIDSQLINEYTFETYVEGNCNELGRSAGYAVANNPGGTAFNPLFLYGGVGLGKTHLAHAIGNHVRNNFPDRRVLYVSSEKFTNQFINALKTGSINDFTYFYQLIDVLIVDDIQFFSSKERTQDIFFHIFNHLHQSSKQIILTSDRPPKELKDIEERLISRFKWGLTADLKRPDFETRMAILETKMYYEGIELPRDVVEYVAYNIDTNVRELEGALVQLIAEARLTKHEVDIEVSKRIVRNVIDDVKNSDLSIELIIDLVCDYYKVEKDLVKGKSRKREIAQPRQLSMYFAKQFTEMSLKKIGGAFGGRDHSTVIHSCNVVRDLMETDSDFKHEVEELEQRFKLAK